MKSKQTIFKSTKPPTMHIFAADPVTIDKSAEWGEGNLQNFPDGVFLQIPHDTVTHGVQPNNDKTAPIGWHHTGNSLYGKNDIIAEITTDTVVTLITRDGDMIYDNPDKNGWICYNIVDGMRDHTDPWFVTNEKFQQLYIPNDKK
jgi:hypothetical protein